MYKEKTIFFLYRSVQQQKNPIKRDCFEKKMLFY